MLFRYIFFGISKFILFVLWIREGTWIEVAYIVKCKYKGEIVLSKWPEVRRTTTSATTLARCDCENWKTQWTTEGAATCVSCIVTQSISLLPLRFSKPTAIDFSSFAIRARKLPDKFVLAGSGRYRTHNDKRSFVPRGSKEERKPGRFKLSRNSTILFVD